MNVANESILRESVVLLYITEPAPTRLTVRSLLLSTSPTPIYFRPPSPSFPPQGLRGPSVRSMRHSGVGLQLGYSGNW